MTPTHNANPKPQEPFSGKVDSDLDHGARIATVHIQDGLALPVTVRIPYVAIKHMAANIAMAEVVQEAGQGRATQKSTTPGSQAGPSPL